MFFISALLNFPFMLARLIFLFAFLFKFKVNKIVYSCSFQHQQALAARFPVCNPGSSSGLSFWGTIPKENRVRSRHNKPVFNTQCITACYFFNNSSINTFSSDSMACGASIFAIVPSGFTII